MSMRASDEQDDEETSVYLSQRPVSTLDESGRDESQHGSDVRGYKPLIHGSGGSSVMPGFVNESVGVVSGRIGEIIHFIQQTFSVKENLERLITILTLSTAGLVLTVFIIILVQHNPRKVSHSSSVENAPPTHMPTYAPGESYQFDSQIGKLVADVPVSYIYQSTGCFRQCYRAPFYQSPSLASLTTSCPGSETFIGVVNSATNEIELGTFQFSPMVFQTASTTVMSGNSLQLTGNDSSGLYWYSVNDGQGKQTTGFSTSLAITFTSLEPPSTGIGCEDQLFFTSTTTTTPSSTADYSGSTGCERFSNMNQAAASLHEIIIFISTCPV